MSTELLAALSALDAEAAAIKKRIAAKQAERRFIQTELAKQRIIRRAATAFRIDPSTLTFTRTTNGEPMP